MTKNVVAVQISGQEYRIRTDADEETLHRVAELVDAAMDRVAARTGTVDTLDVAVLTSLNLGRELMALRERNQAFGAAKEMQAEEVEADQERLRVLIGLAESALEGRSRGQADLLTVPAGAEVDGTETELLDSLLDDSLLEPEKPTR